MLAGRGKQLVSHPLIERTCGKDGSGHLRRIYQHAFRGTARVRDNDNLSLVASHPGGELIASRALQFLAGKRNRASDSAGIDPWKTVGRVFTEAPRSERQEQERGRQTMKRHSS
jgi:hypothetical protein